MTSHSTIATTNAEVSRRDFLRSAGGATLLTGAAALGLSPSAARSATAQATHAEATQRAAAALRLRIKQAVLQRLQPAHAQSTNGDEQRYGNYLGNFTKALPHDNNGGVDPNAYRALLRALQSGAASDFEAITLGGTLKLADPQAAYAFQLEGGDATPLRSPHHPPSPAKHKAAKWRSCTGKH
jgi:hypothetical protein